MLTTNHCTITTTLHVREFCVKVNHVYRNSINAGTPCTDASLRQEAVKKLVEFMKKNQFSEKEANQVANGSAYYICHTYSLFCNGDQRKVYAAVSGAIQPYVGTTLADKAKSGVANKATDAICALAK